MNIEKLITDVTDQVENSRLNDYLVDGLIGLDSHNLIVGFSTDLKLAMAVKLAHAIASGYDFLGFPVRWAGPVLFIGRTDPGEMEGRLFAAENSYGPTKFAIGHINSALWIHEPDFVFTECARRLPILLIFIDPPPDSHEEIMFCRKAACDCASLVVYTESDIADSDLLDAHDVIVSVSSDWLTFVARNGALIDPVRFYSHSMPLPLGYGSSPISTILEAE